MSNDIRTPIPGDFKPMPPGWFAEYRRKDGTTEYNRVVGVVWVENEGWLAAVFIEGWICRCELDKDFRSVTYSPDIDLEKYGPASTSSWTVGPFY